MSRRVSSMRPPRRSGSAPGSRFGLTTRPQRRRHPGRGRADQTSGPSPLSGRRTVRSDERRMTSAARRGGTTMESPVAPGRGRLYRKLAADVVALGLPASSPAPAVVTEADLGALPDAAVRYLNFMSVAGRPPDSSFVAHFAGRFRLRPRLPWMRCEAWQYNSCPTVARLFHMRITAAGVLPMTGRDAYVHGRGRMHGKLAGLVTVADGAGPENDVSELVTYLNDAVLFAPSMLLALPVSWAAAGEASFDIALEDGGHRVTARVRTDERGAPADFSTDDRWCDLPGGPARTRWSTPVAGWTEVNGRHLPSRGSAIWHLPEGPFTYAEFRFSPGGVRYNVLPAQLSTTARASAPARLVAATARVRNWGATGRAMNWSPTRLRSPPGRSRSRRPRKRCGAGWCRSARTGVACTAMTGWRTSSACVSTAPTGSERNGSTSMPVTGC